MKSKKIDIHDILREYKKNSNVNIRTSEVTKQFIGELLLTTNPKTKAKLFKNKSHLIEVAIRLLYCTVKEPELFEDVISYFDIDKILNSDKIYKKKLDVI